MKRVVQSAVVFALILIVIGMVGAADKSKVYYVCNCKDDCACNTVSKEPGNCKCGKELVAVHALAVDTETGIFCRCGAECSCERSKSDPDKCGCGKPVKKVNLKGKYVCACGADCQCLSISEKPGNCNCGKAMKQI